jgi:PAS domain S-box-containing protein
LIAAGLITVLWVLYAQLGRRAFFKWWAWAWTLFAAYLVLGVLTLPLAEQWSTARGGLALVATFCGFVQPALLAFGAISLHSARGPSRRVQVVGLAAVFTVAAVSFGGSLLEPNPLDSFCMRLAPRALSVAAASFFCVLMLSRTREEGGGSAFAVAGFSYLVQGLVQTVYGVAATGRLVAGEAAPFAALFDEHAALRPLLFFGDVISAYGICVGMVLLLIIDFRRSTQALHESLRRQQQALDENAVLQAEIRERRRAEHALRESEDRYRDLVEHSEDLICTHDLEGRILTVNAAPARILGYAPDALTHMNVRELLAPETRHEFDAYLLAMTRDGHARGVMTVMTRGEDRRIWDFRSTLRTDGVPAPVVRAMARDVTDRVNAERALRLSEAKFAAAFRSTPCGVAISTLDEGLVLEINDACQAQTGYQRSEIIGQTTADLGLWVDPAERAAIVSVLRERGKVLNREVRWRAKSGEELTILFSADTVEMRGRSYMLSVALDITAHKQVETRHRAILRAMPDWMFLVSNDGVFLDCHVKNRKYLLAQPADFIGRHVTDVLPGGLADDLTQLFRRAASTDEPATLEYVVPIDGEDRYYEARAVRCDHDKLLAIVRDVTEGKCAEREARRLRQELAHIGRVTTLAALTGSLAHEIRQPLAAIRTNAQAAARIIAHAPALAELRSALADIVGDSQRAADVIQRVSALLRRDVPQHAPLDLNASIEDVARVLRADLLARHISLHLELQRGLPLVHGDRVQLQQVALNFLLNACEAVEHQPEARRRVLLRTRSDAAGVSVSVADTGAGLSDDQLARVFEPFYTTKVDGMGLGLPICEMILGFHDGSLGVERNAAGGLTFWFRLPACPDVAATRSVTSSATGVQVAAPLGHHNA